jgi:hypothetical protein
MSMAIETLASEIYPPVPKRLTAGADARTAGADVTDERAGRSDRPRCRNVVGLHGGRRRLPKAVDATIVLGNGLGRMRSAFWAGVSLVSP